MLADSGQVKQEVPAASSPFDCPSLEIALKKAVVERLGERRFNLWFGEGVDLRFSNDGSALTVCVPSPFFSAWIRDHFTDSLTEAALAVTGRCVQLRFRIETEQDTRLGEPAATAPAEQPPDSMPRAMVPTPTQPNTQQASSVPLSGSPEQSLHRRFLPPATNQCVNPQASQGSTQLAFPRVLGTSSPVSTRAPRQLNSFVTGPGNRLAHAAAREMIATGGKAFNPLLIHGGVGLGKTHLLEAITHGLRQAHPGSSVLFTTAEAFTNSFLEAMRSGALSSFRTRYRGAGALAIDDIHFLAATRATQGEFLHTFNALWNRGVPIVLSADQHPRKITRLTEELITRFLGGMIVKLEAPDTETRRAILQAQAAMRGANVPAAVVEYIVEHVRGSVRELEGALASVIVQATLCGRRLDLAMAHSALRDLVRHTTQVVSLRDVERAVCQLFQIDAESLRSDSRTRALVYPRMLAMYLARKYSGAAYSEIGQYFGGRNHSTVISAEKKVQAWLRAEERNGLLPGFETVADVLADLEATLGT